ncbi:MAG: hypothetical protein LBD56_00910 [Endomicrobium sp.]|nr:hypothetical protein [Endomicrobium sp.]
MLMEFLVGIKNFMGVPGLIKVEYHKYTSIKTKLRFTLTV